MALFHFHADLDDPEKLVAAIASATGEGDVRLLAGWNGCDRVTGEPIAHDVTGKVNIEWLRRKGRFSLDVMFYGRDIAPRETEARLCRAVAKSLGRSVLFSDCSAFAYSYFSAEPDGSIWAQLLVIGDDDDVMDLDTYHHDDPRHCYPRLVFAPDEGLPERAPGDPENWTHGDTSCDKPIPGKLCRAFAAPCPKYRVRSVE